MNNYSFRLRTHTLQGTQTSFIYLFLHTQPSLSAVRDPRTRRSYLHGYTYSVTNYLLLHSCPVDNSINSSLISIEVLVSTSVSPLRTCIKSAHWAHCMYRASLFELSFWCLLYLSLSLSHTHSVFHSLRCLIVVVLDNRLCTLFRISFCTHNLLH